MSEVQAEEVLILRLARGEGAPTHIAYRDMDKPWNSALYGIEPLDEALTKIWSDYIMESSLKEDKDIDE